MLKKLRDDFKGMDLAKTTRDTRCKKEKSIPRDIRHPRLDTNATPTEEDQEGGPQRGGQGPAARRVKFSTDQNPSS